MLLLSHQSFMFLVKWIPKWVLVFILTHIPHRTEYFIWCKKSNPSEQWQEYQLLSVCHRRKCVLAMISSCLRTWRSFLWLWSHSFGGFTMRCVDHSDGVSLNLVSSLGGEEPSDCKDRIVFYVCTDHLWIFPVFWLPRYTGTLIWSGLCVHYCFDIHLRVFIYEHKHLCDDDDLYFFFQKQQAAQRYIPIGYFPLGINESTCDDATIMSLMVLWCSLFPFGWRGGALSTSPFNHPQCPFIQMTDTDVRFLPDYNNMDPARFYVMILSSPPYLPLSGPGQG